MLRHAILLLPLAFLTLLAPAAPAADTDPKTVQALFHQLGDDEFKTREAALNRLVSLGLAILPALDEFKSAGHIDAETAARLKILSMRLAPIAVDNLKKIGATSAYFEDSSKTFVLQIHGKPIPDDLALQFCLLTPVRHLEIVNCPFSDTGSRALANLDGIDYFVIRDSLSPAAIARLTWLPRVKWFLANDPSVTDETIARFEKSTRLEVLNTQLSSVTDAGIARLGDIPTLAQFLTGGPGVTEKVFSHLHQFPALTNLAIAYSPATDDALRKIPHLPKLTAFTFSNTNAGDGLLPFIAAATNLVKLDLHNSAITDAALDTIGKLSQLNTLDLSFTPITSAAIAKLTALPQLKSLNLSGTKINDAAIPFLLKLSSLTNLTLDRTSITKTALADLNKKRPQLQIYP